MCVLFDQALSGSTSKGHIHHREDASDLRREWISSWDKPRICPAILIASIQGLLGQSYRLFNLLHINGVSRFFFVH